MKHKTPWGTDGRGCSRRLPHPYVHLLPLWSVLWQTVDLVCPSVLGSDSSFQAEYPVTSLCPYVPVPAFVGSCEEEGWIGVQSKAEGGGE